MSVRAAPWSHDPIRELDPEAVECESVETNEWAVETGERVKRLEAELEVTRKEAATERAERDGEIATLRQKFDELAGQIHALATVIGETLGRVRVTEELHGAAGKSHAVIAYNQESHDRRIKDLEDAVRATVIDELCSKQGTRHKGLDYLLAAQYENGGWPLDRPREGPRPKSTGPPLRLAGLEGAPSQAGLIRM